MSFRGFDAAVEWIDNPQTGPAIRVVSTYEEIQLSATVGLLRRMDSIRNSRTLRWGQTKETVWQDDIVGAQAEGAFAKFARRYWTGAQGMQRTDVCGYQVRGTVMHDRRLILHNSDADDDPFVFITGTDGVHLIRGWIHGRDGKQNRFLADPLKKKTGGEHSRPAYFVPVAELHSPWELAETLGVQVPTASPDKGGPVPDAA